MNYKTKFLILGVVLIFLYTQHFYSSKNYIHHNEFTNIRNFQTDIDHFFQLKTNRETFKTILSASMRTFKLQLTINDSLLIRNFYTGLYLSNEELMVKIQEPGYAIPSAVHFVYPVGNVTFTYYVSMLSAVWINQPRATIIWHGASPPAGFYWEEFTKNVSSAHFTELIMIQRNIPKFIYGRKIHQLAHYSDVMRIEALLIFGGVYFDLDVFVLKNMKPLRKYKTIVLPDEGSYGLNNGVMLSPPNDLFIKLWHLCYQTFDSHVWAYHSVILPKKMFNSLPHLMHLENGTLAQPTWRDRKLIYNKKRTWNWEKINYSMHLWFRSYGMDHNSSSIVCVDNMYGDMTRFILLGNSTIQSDKCKN